MVKLTSLLTAILALAVVNTASAETLRVGMGCTYAPFNFKDADGNLMGYDVDVAKGVAGLIGADLEFVCQKWDGMIPALLANKFDIVVASMSITDKRLENAKRQLLEVAGSTTAVYDDGRSDDDSDDYYDESYDEMDDEGLDGTTLQFVNSMGTFATF